MMNHSSKLIIFFIKTTTFKFNVDGIHCSMTSSNISKLGTILELGGLGLIVKSLICRIQG